MKKPRRSSKRRRSSSRASGSKHFTLALFLVFLFSVGLGIGFFLGRFFSPGRKTVEVTEITPLPAVPEPPALTPPKRKPKKRRPKVAIVIDDFGYRKIDIDRFKKLPYPIAVSVIPFTPFDIYSAEEAVRHGKPVLIHIPMEANAHGEKIEKLERRTVGMLYTTMSSAEIRRIVRKEILRVPFAVGANNHMGSRFTTDERCMRVVLSELKKAGLFFLDSKTSSRSVGVRVGRSLGMVVLKRDVFLDNSKNVDYIKGQLEQLARIAVKKGYAIAIGHPHLNTLKALSEKLPELEKRGIEVVPIDEIYRELEERYARGLQKTRNPKGHPVSLLSGVPPRHSA